MHKTATAILIAILSVGTGIADDNDRETLLRMASQGYAMNRKDVAPLVDGQKLARVALKGDPDLRPLARLIIARDVVGKSKEYVEEQFGEDVEDLQRAIGDTILESGARQSLSEFLGNDLSMLDEMRTLAQDMSSVAVRTIESQAKQYQVARQGWIAEGLICDEVKRLIHTHKSNDHELEKGAIHLRAHSHMSGTRPFAAFNITNRSDAAFEWAVVILTVDCDYEQPAGSEASTAFGQLLGSAILGTPSPNYLGRDRSKREYAKLDKSAVFYVRDWEPRKIMQAVSLPADEYFNTAAEVKLQVITPKGRLTKTVSLDRHKKYLRDKFAPKPPRRR